MAKVPVTDVCLWLRHVGDDDLRNALASIHPGSKVTLSVNGTPVAFERMATGSNPQPTMGFKPVGGSNSLWFDLYTSDKGQEADVTFHGGVD